MKDKHPTSHAFASFISKFGLPYYQSNERRKPFSVIMFKGIIEKFTIYVPTSPSNGRKS